MFRRAVRVSSALYCAGWVYILSMLYVSYILPNPYTVSILCILHIFLLFFRGVDPGLIIPTALATRFVLSNYRFLPNISIVSFLTILIPMYALSYGPIFLCYLFYPRFELPCLFSFYNPPLTPLYASQF